MVIKLNVVPYECFIKNLDNNERINLIKLDFYKLFKNFLDKNKTIDVSKEKEKTFTIKEYLAEDNSKLIYGICGSGNFGFSRGLIDTITKKRISKITPNQADEIDFYFIMQVFEKKAVFLLSYFKNYSIKSVLQDKLKDFLKEQIKFENKNIIFFPVFDADLLKKSLKEITKMSFIRHLKPNDIESETDLELIEDESEKNKKIVRDERMLSLTNWKLGGIVHKIIDQIKNRKEDGYYKLNSEKYEEVKAEIKTFDGDIRKISIEKLDLKQKTSYKFQGDFPKLEKFYIEVIPYFKEMKNKLNVGIK